VIKPKLPLKVSLYPNGKKNDDTSFCPTFVQQHITDFEIHLHVQQSIAHRRQPISEITNNVNSYVWQ